MQNGKNDWQYWTTYIQDKNNTVWKATLNVAESANGVKYLYDIDPIEKVGQSVKSDTSTTSVGQSVKSDTSTTGDIVAQDQKESQAQIRSSTLSDRDVLRIAAQMAKNSESMLDIKKSLSIADQFPGFNIISVFFLTEFLCIFFDKCNGIFDDISRIHSDSTPLEHFFSMPCREAATLPDCTCVRTMNFNPCAP